MSDIEFDPNVLTEEDKKRLAEGFNPTPAQQRWLDLKLGLFLHFGINTFYDKEWSDGTLDKAGFHPTGFDPDSWMAAAKAAGVGYIMPTTKHHDGFCLWDTDTTTYGAMHSPFKRDVFGEIVAAARRHGIKVAMYYSLWDRHAPMYNDDAAYARYMKRHLAELLTGYGEIVEIWFDGGWKKGGVHYQDPERWHWREIYEHIKAIQPDCLVGNNGTTERPGEIITFPCDLRFGEKCLPPEDDKRLYWTGSIKGTTLPYESQFTFSTGDGGGGMFADGKWFWHEDDHSCRDAKEIVEMLEVCNARKGNLVVNAGPSTAGRLREEDEACLREIGRLRGIDVS